MDRSTVTANLKPLERAGLVTVAVDERDRRGRRVALTDAGRAVLGEATPVWIREHAAIESEIGDGDALRAALLRSVYSRTAHSGGHDGRD